MTLEEIERLDENLVNAGLDGRAASATAMEAEAPEHIIAIRCYMAFGWRRDPGD